MYDRAELEDSVRNLLASPQTTGSEVAVQWLSRLLEEGLTQSAIRKNTPGAPTGGDHGKGEAIKASHPIMRYWREHRFGHLSDYAFARAFKEDADNYFENNFSNNDQRGIVPDDEFLRDVHRLIASGALTSGGRIISDQTILRRIK